MASMLENIDFDEKKKFFLYFSINIKIMGSGYH